jgi:hypothetical protein
MQAHMYRAACVALKVPSADFVCKHQHSAGTCAPGTSDDIRCRKLAKHVTSCVEEAGTANPSNRTKGYCRCGAGWKSAKAETEPKKDTTDCVDLNECTALNTDPCNGQVEKGHDKNQRLVCHNLEGSSECLTAPQLCTEENGWGGCWSEKAPNVAGFSSCVDNIDAYKEKAKLDKVVEENALPVLSKCSCESIAGCFEGGTGACTRACTMDRCSADTKTCTPVKGAVSEPSNHAGCILFAFVMPGPLSGTLPA